MVHVCENECVSHTHIHPSIYVHKNIISLRCIVVNRFGFFVFNQISLNFMLISQMDSLEHRLPDICESDASSSGVRIATTSTPSAPHSASSTAGSGGSGASVMSVTSLAVHAPSTPRIDISRASSSSHHEDSRDSSPENVFEQVCFFLLSFSCIYAYAYGGCCTGRALT